MSKQIFTPVLVLDLDGTVRDEKITNTPILGQAALAAFREANK